MIEPNQETYRESAMILAIFIVLFAFNYDLAAQSDTVDSPQLELVLSIPDSELMPGEPMPVSVRLVNSSSRTQIVKQFGFYSNVGLSVKGPNSSEYSRMGYPLSFAMSPDSIDVVLEPGEYLEDSGYYAYLHEFVNSTGDVYTIQATLNGYISNEVQISPQPSDDAELAELMMRDSVLNNLQGYRPESEGMEILREIARSNRESEYVRLAQFHLTRIESGIDFAKMIGDYYRAPDQSQVSDEPSGEHESPNTGPQNQADDSMGRSTSNDVPSNIRDTGKWTVWILFLPALLVLALCCIWWSKR